MGAWITTADDVDSVAFFVCLTCNRYGPPAPGEATPGRRLADALRAGSRDAGNAAIVRAVECLNGCPHPCTAAFTPGKCLIFVSGLATGGAPALLVLAERYAESRDGNLPHEMFPPALREKISLRLAPLGAD